MRPASSRAPRQPPPPASRRSRRPLQGRGRFGARPRLRRRRRPRGLAAALVRAIPHVAREGVSRGDVRISTATPRPARASTRSCRCTRAVLAVARAVAGPRTGQRGAVRTRRGLPPRGATAPEGRRRGSARRSPPGARTSGSASTRRLFSNARSRRAPGLGFLGKNGLLIVPGLGSHVVLGEVPDRRRARPDRRVRRSGRRPLRDVHGLPRGLPHDRLRRAPHSRRPKMHLVSHDREEDPLHACG